MNYLPVGSQKATEFYAECCLATGVSLINCIPVFIVSRPRLGASGSREAGIPCVGDDIKAQVGATIVHRVLTRLFQDRGVKIDATYQLNTGGNTDFLNMLNQAPPELQADLARPRPSSRSSTCPCRPTRSTSARPTSSLAEGQQGLLPADGGPGLRRRAAEPGAAAERGGLAQLAPA